MIKLAAAMLLTLTVANELSANVTASMPASSNLPTLSKNVSVSKCLGVSSSTMTVGPFLTLLIGITFLSLTGFKCLTADFI